MIYAICGKSVMKGQGMVQEKFQLDIPSILQTDLHEAKGVLKSDDLVR